MDLEIVILSEVVKHRKAKLIGYHLHLESTKGVLINLAAKQEQNHRGRKQTYSYKGVKGERDRQGVGD